MNYYSNIYWHFTGSPKGIDWTQINSPREIRQQGTPKTDAESIEIAKEIFKSRTLKAMCIERIAEDLKTQPFCCVTDIPIQNLQEHCQYYGNVAIGFDHKIIHKIFNPVFYVPRSRFKSKLDTITKPNEVNYGILGSWRYNKDGSQEMVRTPFVNAFLSLQTDTRELGSYIFNYFKITNFSNDPDETFYREREWRKLSDFHFEYSDIAAIITPTSYKHDFENLFEEQNINGINILNWDFLKII
jgi:Putative abortive phage resistance protein AbiGi, antitoxin